MDEPIEADPATEVCPNFMQPVFQTARTSMIENQNLPDIQTHEDAAQELANAWSEDNAERCEAYAAQQDALERERLDLELQARDAQRQESQQPPRNHTPPPQPPRQPEPEDQPAPTQRKRVAPPIVRRDRMISSTLPSRPSQFAINKVQNYEYVDLWYFTPDGYAEAARQAKATDDEGFTLAGGESGERLGLKAMTTASASKNAILDEALPWNVFTDTRQEYLDFLASVEWPERLYADMAAFFARIETHRIRKTDAGKRALLEYQARARRDWHDSIKRNGETFDLAAINEELLKIIADEQQARDVRAQAREIQAQAREVELLHAELKASRTQDSSSQARGKRKRGNRSRSPPRYRNTSRSKSPPSRYSKAKSGAPGNANDAPQARIYAPCAVCLGRGTHDVAKCNAKILWDKTTPARCRRDGEGRIINPQGQILCFNFQRKAGCPSRSHDDRHECTGCGKRDHGAARCPLAEKP
ncbi:hypothetical protein BD779DRAFT_1553147 [Infundibulicybe gibba]|nr:hypothetical protein BD779DRAFT_1553147 [Infundibulicybe gibba]